jgi:hypothetical protein
VSLKLYMDVHIRQAVTDGLRRRGVDVLTAQEDNAARLSDDELLDRAMALGRVLFSQDETCFVKRHTGIEVQRSSRASSILISVVSPMGSALKNLPFLPKWKIQQHS